MAKRKKNTKTSDRNRILEYKGWKAGDRCYTVFSGETKPSLCDIKEFHPKDSVTPAVSVIEVTTGKSRVAAIMAIAEEAKEAKKLQPKWNKFLARWKKKQSKLQLEARREEAKRRKEEAEAAEKEKAAAELEAQEEETRKLKEEKNA